MATIYADQQGILASVTVGSTDADGAPFEQTGIVIPILLPDDQIAELLASYDPTASASPSAADSRVIARVILDSLRTQQGL
jgi:hypothetical protein